jgi:anti-anti-sigma regulatory factor
MKLTITPQKKSLRFLFERESPDERPNLFHQINPMAERIIAEYKKTKSAVVFDISGLESIDSAFISVLVRSIKAIPWERVTILVGSDAIMKLLEELGIPSMVRVEKAEAEIGLR